MSEAAAGEAGWEPTLPSGRWIELPQEGRLFVREIDVEFVDFIRADRKFDSSEALINQMQADCERIRDILADR